MKIEQKDDFLTASLLHRAPTDTGVYQPVVRVTEEPLDVSSPVSEDSYAGFEPSFVMEDADHVCPNTGFTPEQIKIPQWWGFLGRPWTHYWRCVLGGGVAVCVLLWFLAAAIPGFYVLYTLAMSAWIPLVIITLFYELEMTRCVNWGTIILVTCLGGGAAIALTLIFNAITGNASVELAGMREEPAKGIILLALAMNTKRFPGILSGLVLGVCVGAGFAIIETFDYAYLFGTDGKPSTNVLILRGVLSPFAHMAWTGALGGALWAARGWRRGGWCALQSWTVWGIFVMMILFHCLWNTLGPVEYLSCAVWVLIFYYLKRGISEALDEGFQPKGSLA